MFTPSSYIRYDRRNFLCSLLPHISFRVCMAYLNPLEAASRRDISVFLSFGRNRKAGIENAANNAETVSHVRLKYPPLTRGMAIRRDRMEPA